MVLYLVAVVAGLAIGRGLGGRLSGFAATRLRLVPLVVAAVAVQVALTVTARSDPRIAAHPSGLRLAALAVSYLLAGAFVAANIPGRARLFAAGLGCVLAGWLANLLAILANSGMPVSAAALASAGLRQAAVPTGGLLAKHVIARAGGPLTYLGDVIPIGPLRTIVSVGDLLMLVGIVAAIAGAMRAYRSEETPTTVTGSGDRVEPCDGQAKG